jgi:hypothetical protein
MLAFPTVMSESEPILLETISQPPSSGARKPIAKSIAPKQSELTTLRTNSSLNRLSVNRLPTFKRIRRFFARFVTDWWLLELASLLLSLLLFGGMVAVLASWNGSAVSEWHYDITINTVIAVLSTASKACLLLPVSSIVGQARWMHFRHRRPLIELEFLDAASRGPFGSFQVLARVRNVLAVLSAVLALFALAFESFAQQSEIAIMPSYVPVLSSLSDIPPDDSLLGDMQSFAMAGMANHINYGQGVYYAPPSTKILCSRNRCDIPPFATLSLCSTCSNVTDQIVTNCDQEGQFCNSTLPSGAHLNEKYEYVAFFPEALPSDNTPSDHTLLAKISMIATPYGYFNNGTFESITPTTRMAHSCLISLCAKVYAASSWGDNGILFRVPYEYQLASVNRTRTVVKSDSGTFVEVTVSNGTLLTSSNPSAPRHNTIWQNSIPPFQADLPSLQFLRAYLTSTFNGTVDRSSSNSTNDYLFSYSPPTDYFQRKIGSDLWALLSYNAFAYPGQDYFDAAMDGLTTGIANALRNDMSGTPANAASSIGSPLTEPIISVRWAWLSLPLILEVLAVLLLGTTIFLTKKQRMPIWKSSTIATLFHGVDQREYLEGVETEDISLMREIAGEKIVKLVVTPLGYRLVGSNDEG